MATKRRRIGALEAEDRLLRITDGEDGARCPATGFAAAEFLAEAGNDVPLIGARILCLVDQDVVDPAIEPVEHELRHPALQQFARQGDQVVIIIALAATLLGE